MGDSPKPTLGRFDTEAAPVNSGWQAADIIPGTAIGEYVVDAKIGEGGMGTVYSVTHPLIGKKAAIKVMNSQLCQDASAVERFILEARSVNQIGHPNIVDVFAFGKLSDGRSYFIMEWLQGESLALRIERGALSLRECADFLAQIADALEAAHEKNVVHRDLKPDNIFLVPVRSRRIVVKLLDFGIAKLLGTGLGMSKTRTGQFVGTPGYMSPEQARGKPVGQQTDVYALGVTAYEMLTGQLPFVADNLFDTVHLHLNAPAPSVRTIRAEVPDEIDEAVRAMMAKEPSDRPSLSLLSELFGGWRDELLRATGPHATLGAPRTPSKPGVAFNTPAPLNNTPAPLNNTPAPLASTPTPNLTPAVAVEILPMATTPVRSNRAVVLGLACTMAVVGAAALRLVKQKSDPPPPQPIAAVVVAPAPEPPRPVPVVARPAEPPVVPLAVLSELVIHANVPNANFSLDGRPIAQAAAEARLKLDAEGPHNVLVTAPRRQSFTTTIYLTRGNVTEVHAKLERVSGPSRPGKSKDYVLDLFQR